MPRILFNLTLKNQKLLPYSQDQLQGFVYNLIRKAGFSYLHDLPADAPRFFSFSGIFKNKKGSYNFIFASAINDLIEKMLEVLKNLTEIRVGLNSFKVEGYKKLQIALKHPVRIYTETPIIIRVPSYRFKDYGLNFENPYPYFYWRPIKDKVVPFEPFVKQLTARIYKMYKLFNNKKDIEEKEIFSKFLFIKTIDLPYFKNGKKISRIGSIWEFEFFPEIEEKLINFILDTGLGELTSQGYGFVNQKR